MIDIGPNLLKLLDDIVIIIGIVGVIWIIFNSINMSLKYEN